MLASNGAPYIYASLGGLYPGDIIIQLVCFLILLLVAKKYAWGPILNMMKKREDYINSEIDAAEASRTEAAELATKAEERLRAAKEDAQKVLEDARSLATKQEQDIIAQAKQEAERLKQAAKADIQHEKEKAVQALQDQVASLSVMIATKVIEKELSEQDQERLIADYVKQLGETE